VTANKRSILPRFFYERDEVVEISRDLIGKIICTNKNGQVTSGIITETEAYSGRNDRACHANDGLRTERTEIMYGPGGYSYVYLCYGIHYLFNIVTNKEKAADAVLIRAIHPIEGVEVMKKRRNITNDEKPISSGPGILSQALGINKNDYGVDLTNGPIWIEDRSIQVRTSMIRSTPRIGVDYAGEHAKRKWRFITDQFKVF